MSITLSQQSHPVCNTECRINCPRCGDKSVGFNKTMYCPYCSNYRVSHTPTTSLPSSDTNSIFYTLVIEFHNYVHEFSSSYCYEVVCKIPQKDKPDEYLFHRVEPRLNKTIIFKNCYLSTACGDKFNDLASSNLYFGVRRINSQTDEMSIPALLTVISTLQDTDGQDCKVILQAKDSRVTVHKSILVKFSDVFRAMFAHNMKEKQYGVIEVAEFESEVVKKMVDYLYTRKLGNIEGVTQELFKIAHRYQIHELCHRCEEYYLFNVYFNNGYIVEMLELTDLYGLEKLKKNSDKFVQRYEKVLSELSSYQKYLCRSINISKAANTLVFANKYNIQDVKICALDFIKRNYCKIVESKDFMNLFSNPRLMEEIYVFFSK